MPYCITLRSRTDARITGWYDGSHSRWSTDRNRQKVFDRKRDAAPVCHELRKLCPRNANVINIEPPNGGSGARDGDYFSKTAELNSATPQKESPN